jgi:hypothetical protein
VIAVLAAVLAFQLYVNYMPKQIIKEQPRIAAKDPVPAPSPVDKAAPSPEGPKGYITANELNLRKTPTIKGNNVILRLHKGQPALVKEYDKDWVMVEVEVSGVKYDGWVYKSYLLIPD